MRIKSERDFFSGLLFVAAGAAFVWAATAYPLGSAQDMGPGYFPLVVGVVLGVLGAFIVFGALVVETEDGDPVGPWAWKPLFAIVGANLAFGALLAGVPALGLPPMGLVVAVVALTLIASLATGRFAWKESIVLCVVFTIASWLIFVVALKLKLPSWPPFIGG